MKRLTLLMITLAVGGPLMAADPKAPLTIEDLKKAQIEAKSGLAKLRRLLLADDVKRLGFDSTNEVYQAVLGEPFRVYQVGLLEAKQFAPGQPLANLVEPVPRVIFPLMVGTNTKCSILVRREAGGWITETWGRPGLIKQITHTRNTYAGTNAQAASGTFAVEVPVVGLWFLGYTNANNTVELLTTGELKIGSTNIPPQTRVSLTPDVMLMVRRLAERYKGGSN